MPTTYAHDLFGKMVFQKLDPKLQNVILKNKPIFQIGLHGPDILFYHEPFHKNAVSSLGSRIHQDIAADFFLRGKQLYLKEREEKILAYLLGFICHYMLDSTCHPYIGEYIKATGATHDEIETDFDRYLMETSGKKPFSYKPGIHLKATADDIEVISKVIGEVSETEVKKAVKGIRFYTSVTVGHGIWRGMILKASKMIHCYDYIQGRVMRRRHLSKCEESTRELTAKFKLLIPETVTVIEEFYGKINDADYINARFYRNYE